LWWGRKKKKQNAVKAASTKLEPLTALPEVTSRRHLLRRNTLDVAGLNQFLESIANALDIVHSKTKHEGIAL
jgi:hypothetical protein